MRNSVISVEHLTKQYDLGVIGTGTLSRDLERWWARVRKQADPYTRIGQKDAFERIGETIQALDDISFTVQQGEALGIIGSNGAGKSTLLKILSRVTAPTSGVVKVKGRIGSLLEVGTGFHPDLTGRENVYLNGAILGMKKSEVARKFDEIVAFSGVEKFIDTPVKRYSSGMYVRLAFAVAAHLDPEILIVDEVLAVGDAEFQKKCLGKMGDVATEGRTVLFVSHNMTAIEHLCTKALLIKNGKIDCSGTVNQVIEKYLTNSDQIKSVRDLSTEDALHQGKGDVKFTTVTLNTNLLNNVSQLKIHESFEIYLELLGLKETTNLDVGVAIFDKRNTRICGLNSKAISNFSFNIQETEKIKLVCKIPDQNLAPGTYYLNVIVRSNNTDILDYIPNITSFEVIPSDYFGTGKLPFGENLILLENNWEIVNN